MGFLSEWRAMKAGEKTAEIWHQESDIKPSSETVDALSEENAPKCPGAFYDAFNERWQEAEEAEKMNGFQRLWHGARRFEDR